MGMKNNYKVMIGYDIGCLFDKIDDLENDVSNIEGLQNYSLNYRNNKIGYFNSAGEQARGYCYFGTILSTYDDYDCNGYLMLSRDDWKEMEILITEKFQTFLKDYNLDYDFGNNECKVYGFYYYS